MTRSSGMIETEREERSKMKLLFTSDWHIGRTLNGYSLLEEQKYAFEQILALALAEKVDGVIIAGDLYDSSVPKADFVTTFEQMLRKMNLEHQLPIYAISGNHDSAKRLNFSREWMQHQQLYLNTFIEEAMSPVETEDCQLFLLPYFDPMDARIYLQEEQGWSDEEVKNVRTLADAMQALLPLLVARFAPGKKRILVTHFAVTASGQDPQDLTSETSSTVGGLATLNAEIFSDFNYVALGHIHTHHASPSETVQYSGSPVKFNVKEAGTDKGVYILEFDEKGVESHFVKLEQETDLVALKEDWETLTDPGFYQTQPCHQAWFAIQVQDFDRNEHVGKNLRAQLEQIYGTVVELDYSYKQETIRRTRGRNVEELDESTIIGDFYQESTGQSLSSAQLELVEDILTKISKEKS